MTKHTRRVLELGAGLALALTVVLTAYADWHQRTAARVRADTVRLHILANSDTWDDQLLKLQVRPPCRLQPTVPCTAPTARKRPPCGWKTTTFPPAITAAFLCPAGSTPPCA